MAFDEPDPIDDLDVSVDSKHVNYGRDMGKSMVIPKEVIGNNSARFL